MNWSTALQDSEGSADIAYISIAGLVLILIATVIFLCAMSGIAYARCSVIVEAGASGNLVKAFVPCSYDPNPLGLAIAACLGAFGSPIGALALYMNQTRRQPNPRPPIVAAADNVNINPPASPVKQKRRR